MGLNLFLDQSSRFREAIQRFDPLEGERLINILDPINKNLNFNIPYLRIYGTYAGIAVLIAILSCISYPIGNGCITGQGSLLKDYGSLGIILSGLILPLLVIWGRRVLGDLINTLEAERITISLSKPFRTNSDPSTSKVLTCLDNLSSAKISMLLMPIIWIGNARLYYDFLADNQIGWQSVAVNHDSIMSILSVGGVQPSLAGLIAYLVLWPLIGFMYVPAIRLFVMLMFISYKTSLSHDLKISPAHPDGVGGLIAFGHASVFLSGMMFASGLALSGMTLQWYQTHTNTTQLMPITVITYWILYLCLGPALLLAPLLPLKKCMEKSKRNYIIKLRALYVMSDSIHLNQIANNEYDPACIEERTKIGVVIEAAENMSIWPLDKKTLARFITFILTPIAPLVTDKLPIIIDKIKNYFI